MIGIYTEAFEAEYKSVDDMLNRPDLEDADYVPLNWKVSERGKKIFRTNYADFCDIFHRILLVMGVPGYARLYALRVNAASILRGMCPKRVPSSPLPILITASVYRLSHRGRGRLHSQSHGQHGREILHAPPREIQPAGQNL